MSLDPGAEALLRACAPQVLGALVRRYGHFDLCEDAVQEALLAAAQQWPADGTPDNPRAWLITVASRRLTDRLRSEEARERREETAFARTPGDAWQAPGADEERGADRDDTLTLLFLCCHPELSEPSQVALTLRAVGGLTTAEIARAFLVPEATMAQRISRAKQKVKQSGAKFVMPPPQDRPDRMRVVLHVLYLVFNEGYTASSGDALQRTDLTAEAIRLGREVRRLLPDDAEAAGLLALMLLTDARRAARTRADGALVPLADQDRSRWNREFVAEGVALVTEALPRGEVGPYQLQAAIAAVHDEAATAEETDWVQILGLYDLLRRVAPGPVVELNRAVALAEVFGPKEGLAALDELAATGALRGHHRLASVRAHLMQRAGEGAAAREGFAEAARLTTSEPERRYLEERARASDG
ncbi:RNA polymerase sigma factor [Yinghuangia seranimata]|uniref:RNA polymerase sigma factor n=1 Tax=Yinghuangia seranimata TaxID=408067 RepID=UPI00248B71EF|nr:sigma-70 family RNA polymerase sigma factor [Yinghuangia seranimata]MDI2124878.1 sigma-70 family RNA polymerase sigma factor [Yinghuangia seranimata]